MPEFELKNILTEGRKEVPDRSLIRISLGALPGTVNAGVQIPGQRKPRVYRDLPIRDGAIRLPVKLAFLSYAREDARFVADLARRLLQHGVMTWFDRKDLLPGDDWRRKIDDGIERSDFVLTFVSPASVNKTGYFQRELKYAIEQRQLRPEGARYIIPIVIGDCEPPSSVRDIQWLRTESRGWYQQLLRAMDN